MAGLRARFSFAAKAGGAAVVVAAADVLLFARPIGSTLGAAATIWALAVVVLRPDLRRDPRALAAFVLACGFAAALIDNPDPLKALLFCIALGSAALLPRIGRFRDAMHWTGRLFLQGLFGLVGPVRDARRLLAVRRHGGRRGPTLTSLIVGIALPLAGATLFLVLFAGANPVLGRFLNAIDLGRFEPGRPLFWAVVLIAVWSTLRPRVIAFGHKTKTARRSRPPLVPLASIVASLVLFNAVFAVENGLDLAFLWSGAPLPAHVTLAEYAHRGAYTLVATALLAGLFVLIALRPGSETARRPLVRWLVVAWVAQNLLLLASSALRLADYIDAYSLTRLRIAALVWMALVGVGLALVCWRLLRGRSGAWLINANALAALVVLCAGCSVDLGEVCAAWNVRHAREAGGHGADLDVDYLQSLGGSAFSSVTLLERRPLAEPLRRRIACIRRRIQSDLNDRQGDWRRWTWRGQRQLDAGETMLRSQPLPITGAAPNACLAAPAPTPTKPD